jgi:hypothetical protein
MPKPKAEDRTNPQQAGWTKTGPAQLLVVEQPETKGSDKPRQNQADEGDRGSPSDD